MNPKFCVLVVLALAGGIQAETVRSSPCEEKTVASVNQVAVIPCPPPGDGASEPCKLIRGAIATISVDFVPDQDLKTPKVTLYHLDQGKYLPYIGLNHDLCRGLSVGACPIQAASSNTWSTDIKLSRAFPLSSYPLKIKIVDASNEAVVVCQTFTVELSDAATK